MKDVEPVTTVREADVVMFLGGEDVSPYIYKQTEHKFTQANPKRDEQEVKIYDEALRLGKHIIGICRGSQFVCAKQPDGMLVQHQPNPSYLHDIKTHDGKTLLITSTHHQAMYPFNMPKEDYKILGWTEGMLPYHQGGASEELDPEKECEIVYFPKSKALGIQGHPEAMSPDHPTCEWLRNLVDEFLNNKL